MDKAVKTAELRLLSEEASATVPARGAHAIKRAIDIAIAALGLAALAPLLGLIALLVRCTSPGPALFRQWRLGLMGRPFLILKFRSMYVSAPDMRNPDGSASCPPSDPRVTSVGKFLRRTSLDELPQLWNVLKGEMSLVGPRPDQLDQLQYYSAREKVKLRMRPGITGLAQVSGRNAIAWERRKQLDCQYVENWSLALDLSILLKTIPCVLKQRGIEEETRNDRHS